jgi:nucleoside phosphorylase
VLLPLPPALTFLSISNNHQHLDVSTLLAAAAAAAAAVQCGSSGSLSEAAAVTSIVSSSSMLLQEQQQQQLRGLQHLEISALALSEPHLLTGLLSLTQLVAKELKVMTVAAGVCGLTAGLGLTGIAAAESEGATGARHLVCVMHSDWSGFSMSYTPHL